jgi:hypothetical protein
MRYMLLVYSEETDSATAAEENSAVFKGHQTVMEETGRRGILRAAEPLEATPTATTVRARNGEVLITDGPFAETKEQLAGYYILDCEDLDEAISWASKIPTSCQGGTGCVEIRPIRELQGVRKN